MPEPENQWKSKWPSLARPVSGWSRVTGAPVATWRKRNLTKMTRITSVLLYSLRFPLLISSGRAWASQTCFQLEVLKTSFFRVTLAIPWLMKSLQSPLGECWQNQLQIQASSSLQGMEGRDASPGMRKEMQEEEAWGSQRWWSWPPTEMLSQNGSTMGTCRWRWRMDSSAPGLSLVSIQCPGAAGKSTMTEWQKTTDTYSLTVWRPEV